MGLPNEGSLVLWVNPSDLTSSTNILGIAGTYVASDFTKRMIVGAAGFSSTTDPVGNYVIPSGSPGTTTADQLREMSEPLVHRASTPPLAGLRKASGHK